MLNKNYFFIKFTFQFNKFLKNFNKLKDKNDHLTKIRGQKFYDGLNKFL